jgi:hypothetical protein
MLESAFKHVRSIDADRHLSTAFHEINEFIDMEQQVILFDAIKQKRVCADRPSCVLAVFDG